MTTQQYRAIKNFFHNTMRLDRSEVKDILREIVGEVVRDEVRRYLETTHFQRLLEGRVNSWAMDIRRAVANALVERFDIDISVRPK